MPRFTRLSLYSRLFGLCLLGPLAFGTGYAQIVNDPTTPPGKTTPATAFPNSSNPAPAPQQSADVAAKSAKQDDVDFGPYVAKLQKTIRHNWHPPTLEYHNRIKARFHIDRNGQLSELSITESKYSDPKSVNASLAAIRKSAPFDPLPTGFKGNDILVEFIFDYELKTPGKPTSASNNSPSKSILPKSRLGAFMFKLFEI